MYDKRIKFFVILIASLLLICLLRLTQMQLLPDSSLQDEIAKLKLQRGLYRQLKTIRGKILDRNGKVLATDQPQFQLHINYRLSCFLDQRVRRARLLKAAEAKNPILAVSKVKKELQTAHENLQQIIDKCTYFGLERTDIEEQIEKINNRIWNLRTFVAWVRNGPDPSILEKYNHKINSIPFSEAIADFQSKFPDQNQRLLLTAAIGDIADMDETQPLLELKTDDSIFAAQLEFLDTNGVQILAKAHRFYPYRSAAAQTIGWVGPATEQYRLPSSERLSKYLSDELCGREGVEYVCEAALRGKRGQVVYDIDRQLISRTETQFGKDVQLSLDIDLQQRIENYLANCNLNPNCNAPTAVVVIDVATADILALVSVPVFDLNRIRYDYTALINDPNNPLQNRAINKQYPPGSTVKPLILIAGLQTGNTQIDEIINCPAQKAPKGWPSCWLYNKYPWMGHDDKWQNYARNAIKGSCNIYFSRLADRIDPLLLQQWLFKFGYGRISSLVPRGSQLDSQTTGQRRRDLRQVQGIISSSIPKGTISYFEEVPPLESGERRYFGIGQGNLRATPLQVANAFATIARGGLFKHPRLFIDDANNVGLDSITLNISPDTLDIVRDGMGAVVNEPDGTAYKEFVHSGLAEQGIMVYGKTGSTEKPDVAWFAGFAEDDTGNKVALAVLVEGGQHGSADAGPLARDIIQFCIEAGYIGQASLTNQQGL